MRVYSPKVPGSPQGRPLISQMKKPEWQSLSEVTGEAEDPRTFQRAVGWRSPRASCLCPCRGPGRPGRAAAAGHGAAAEREARGALEMRGAGPRDPVSGRGAAEVQPVARLASPPQLWLGAWSFPPLPSPQQSTLPRRESASQPANGRLGLRAHGRSPQTGPLGPGGGLLLELIIAATSQRSPLFSEGV